MSTHLEDIERAAKEKELAHLRELAVLGEVVATEAGLELMQRLVKLGGIFSTSIAPMEHLIWFNEGARNLVNKLLADIEEVSPAALAQILTARRKD